MTDTTTAGSEPDQPLGLALTDLLGRLEAHACMHDDLVMHDTEQAQWAADLRAAKAEIEQLRRALHEIAEEWAGAECGDPVHAQEAYAIGLAKRMYALAVEGLTHTECEQCGGINCQVPEHAQDEDEDDDPWLAGDDMMGASG